MSGEFNSERMRAITFSGSKKVNMHPRGVEHCVRFDDTAYCQMNTLYVFCISYLMILYIRVGRYAVLYSTQYRTVGRYAVPYMYEH